jgi:hypothetical protein
MTYMTSHPMLDTFVRRGPYEVRHLLLGGDDPGANTLVQIAAGVRTVIATGTQYEMQKRQDELMQQWGTEGFQHEKLAFEPWSHVRTLLTEMGYLALFDPQLTKNPKKMNLTGRVLLSQWTGRRAKDGTEYDYGFDGNTLSAYPRVPSHVARMLEGKKGPELIAAMSEIVKYQNSLGPSFEFVVSDR